MSVSLPRRSGRAPRHGNLLVRGAVARGLVVLMVIAWGSASGSATATPTATDKTIAKAGVVTLRDFPVGWAAKPRTSRQDSTVARRAAATIRDCKKVQGVFSFSAPKGAAHVRSGSYTDGMLTIDNSVSVYRSAADAASGLGLAKRPAFSRCLQALFKKLVVTSLAATGHASEVQRLEVVIERAHPPVSIGDDQVAFAATVNATVQGSSLALYLDFFVIRADRALVTFDYQDTSTPIADPLPSVIEAAVTRLEGALIH